MIRLLVVAASAIARAGLQSVAAAGADVEVVGAAGLADLNAALDRWQPDVVLAALDGNVDEPPEELMSLAARDGGPAIVVLAADLQPSWAADALRSGIRGVLPGDVGPREILAAVAAAAVGLLVMHPQELPALAAERPLPATPAQLLSPREIEVLGMLAEGHGNKTIAWKLAISEHTVKFHVGSILSKLGAGTRTEAVALAIRKGMVML